MHFAEDSFFQSPYGGDVSLSHGSQDFGEEASHAAIFVDEEGWQSCGTCGAYQEDDANSTDTESEFEMVSVSEEDWEAYLGSFEGTTLSQLREEYFLAKARFRHAAGKRSRGSRFPRRAP